MPRKTVWEHINLALPSLHRNATETLCSQEKGSTEWAAHSHTPMGLAVWEDFEQLVEAEGKKDENKRFLDIEFAAELQSVRLKRVKKEEDVTDNLERVLENYADARFNISGGVTFAKATSHILAEPDIIAEIDDPDVWGDGGWDDYSSPIKGHKAGARKNVLASARALYRYPFETKPWWKFEFLNHDNGHQTIISEWRVPENFDPLQMRDESALPKEWSNERKKIFHAVRQLYGQMVTDKRRYGILHIYQKWFFCIRTDEEIVKLSRPFSWDQTSPSVLQAIKTVSGFKDYELESKAVHPSSSNNDRQMIPPSYGGGSSRGLWDDSRGQTPDSGGAGASLDPENIASSVRLWDCNWFDSTERIHLLTLKQDPSVLVKLQKNSRVHHVARDMEHEAEMYLALSGNQVVHEFLPRFLGYSTHLGVGLSCIEKELDDFDDIGLENLSAAAKHSAVRGVEALSSAGVLHNDIELRNIVKSKDNPNRAKIIDLGRASFSKDDQKLAAQVQRIKYLLGVE